MRMSGTEALMWTVEKDPALRSDFVNLTVLDRQPEQARLRAVAERAVTAIPRLRQRVVAAPLRITTPEWVDDRDFDVDYHLRRVRVPSPGGRRELLDVCANLAEMPFDRSRPLWEFTVLEGVEGSRAALLQKIHHVIVDGVGGLKLSLAIVDMERDPADALPEFADPFAEPSAVDERHGPLENIGRSIFDAACGAAGVVRDSVNTSVRLATHRGDVPGALTSAFRLADSARRQVLVVDSARSPLMTQRSLRRHFETFEVSLDAARAVAARYGTTVNDVYVAAIAGALGAYHEAMGTPIECLRMAMPVSMRGRQEVGGNRFAPLRVLVPVGPKDAALRVAAVHGALATTRNEPALDAADGLAGIASRLPTSMLVSFTRAQARTIDFTTSNLRGSPVPLFMAGARIEASYPMGPRAGAAVNVTMMSYCNEMHMGINLDPAAITDRATFMECLAESWGAILDLG